MFDPAALSLPVSAPALTVAPVQNPGNAADPTDGASSTPTMAFDALLALQVTPAEPANAPLPEGGKILPDPAKLVAGLSQLRAPATPARMQQAPARTATQAAEDHTLEDGTDSPDRDLSLDVPQLPDPALIAAIFAAPDRLADAGATREDIVPGGRSPVSPTAAVPSKTMPPAAAVATIVETARIDIEKGSDEAPVPANEDQAIVTSTAQVMAARQTRHKKTAPSIEAVAPEAAAAKTIPAQKPALPERDLALAPVADRGSAPLLSAENPLPSQDTAAPSPVRAEPRTERIDFATLVDTLARAREDASPRTVTASVHHAEFGRVTLRFDKDDDRGMSVAMSSADPGFARAVSATTEAARTPTDSTGQNAQSQTEARAQGGQSENPRQQPRQAEQAQGRPLAANGASTQADDATRDRSDDHSIYA